MIRRLIILATSAAVALTVVGIAPAQATVPDISAITATPSTIYPLVANAKRPGSTTIKVTGNDPSTVAALEIRNAADVKVRDLSLDSVTFQVSWNGRDNSNVVVPAGTYKIIAIGAGSDVSTVQGSVTVSTKKLIAKTYLRTVTAVGSMVDKVVGRCSTLAKPSKRHWRGSLGFYANTRCKTQTFRASAVTTAHAVRLPVAESYTNVRVNVFGGAATARKISRGQLTYITGASPFHAVSPVMVGKKVGLHRGALRSAAGMVDSRRYFVWDFTTAYNDRYDVKTFTVVVHYLVLG